MCYILQLCHRWFPTVSDINPNRLAGAVAKYCSGPVLFLLKVTETEIAQ